MPSRVGRVMRAFVSHQCGLGLIPARWFSPWFESFSPGSPVFLPQLKPTSPNSNSTRIEDLYEQQLRIMWLLLWIFSNYVITKSALWLVNQLWVIVPVNPRKNRAFSELLYKSNRPQVFYDYKGTKFQLEHADWLHSWETEHQYRFIPIVIEALY